jgi:hypothetical protein
LQPAFAETCAGWVEAEVFVSAGVERLGEESFCEDKLEGPGGLRLESVLETVVGCDVREFDAASEPQGVGS